MKNVGKPVFVDGGNLICPYCGKSIKANMEGIEIIDEDTKNIEISWPESLTYISAEAFKGLDKPIKTNSEVSWPESLTYISTDAFEGLNKPILRMNYHFVFCPRYRRNIFDIENVELRFKELVNEKCKEMEIKVRDIRCKKDRAYLLLSCNPTESPARIVKKIKEYTSSILIKEIPKLSKVPNLWTMNFLASTEPISNEIIEAYVDQQKTRY